MRYYSIAYPTLLLAFLMTCLAAADEPLGYAIDSIVPRNQFDGTFELNEFVVSIRGAMLNPFRFAEMALDAEFTLPSGKVMVVPGFYSQDYKLENHRGVAIENSSGWRIRFSGSEEGEYHFKVTLRIRGVPVTTAAGPSFALKKSSQPGMIRISPAAPRYLEYDDGTPYFAIGQNVCFTSDVAKRLPSVKMNCETLPWDDAYAQWFERMGKNGANWARIWMRPNFCLEANQPWQWSMENAWRFDRVLDMARKNGLNICLCFNSERNDDGKCYKGTWEGFRASSTAWGVLLKSHEAGFADFSTLEAAREMYRDKIRYIVARWGYSPNIFCWELWNEIECVEVKDMPEWAKEMTAYLRQIDPWRHLIKSSAHYPNSSGLWSAEFGDLNDVHAYFGWAGVEEPKNLGSFLPQFSAGVRGAGRPFLIGEAGVAREVETKYGLAGDLQDQDTTCFSMHESLWSGLFSGAAGTGMAWWWDEHVDLQNGYFRFRAIANFVRDVPFTHEAFVYRENTATSASPLKVFELTGRNMRLLWVRHSELCWYGVAVEKKTLEPIRDAILTLHNLKSGSYKVELWDTNRGDIISTETLSTTGTTLEIHVKNVLSELALKVSPKNPN